MRHRLLSRPIMTKNYDGRENRRWLAVYFSLLFSLWRRSATRRPSGAGLAAAAAPAQKLVKLAFVTNNTSEFWKIAGAGVHKYEKEGKVQVDIKMPPNGTPEEQNQILENLVEPGLRRASRSASIAPNDQVPRAQQGRREDQRSSPSTPTRRSPTACSTSAPTTTRPARCWASEIVKLLPNGGKMAVFVGHASRPTTPRSASRESRTRSPATRSRSSTSARTTPIAPRRAPTSRTSSTPTPT